MFKVERLNTALTFISDSHAMSRLFKDFRKVLKEKFKFFQSKDF